MKPFNRANLVNSFRKIRVIVTPNAMAEMKAIPKMKELSIY